MKVSINIIKNSFNSGRVCRAMAEGIGNVGDKIELRSDHDFRMKGFDAAVFWGYWEPCQLVERSCREAGIPFVYVDLAYWKRERGYFKAAVNARHPDAYLMNWAAPGDRWDSLGVKIKPWRKSTDRSSIVVAGMSGKAAWSWGFGPTIQQAGGVYERGVIERLKSLTKRPIIYRPKPNWAGWSPIDGSKCDREAPVDQVLNHAHCVITHHSNVGSDAIVAGVPVFARRGAALAMGLPDSDLTRIEEPAYPDGREQWAANLAYCQWTLDEMSSGVCWKHIKARVL